jgi:GNAT superfamily N-acetyltransferase
LQSTSFQVEKHIRFADSGEAAAIAAVLYEAFREFEPLYTLEGFAATTPKSEQILERMSEGPVWVALVDGEIVGTVSVVLKREALYVRGMAVLPRTRGASVGKLLMEQVERYAVEKGCKRLFLSTTPFLERAIRLYEKFGLRRTPEGPHDLFGTPLFTMEKRLDNLEFEVEGQP